MTDHLPECPPIDYSNGEIMNIPNAMPTLSRGSHRPDEGQACVMEYVALLAGEEWTDRQACTHPVLTWAAQLVNDRLDDEERHLLIPLIGRLFGTSAPVEERRLSPVVAHYASLDVPVGEHDPDDLVGWLSGVIDIYDELSGRTTHREVTDQDLAALALAVKP